MLRTAILLLLTKQYFRDNNKNKQRTNCLRSFRSYTGVFLVILLCCAIIKPIVVENGIGIAKLYDEKHMDAWPKTLGSRILQCRMPVMPFILIFELSLWQSVFSSGRSSSWIELVAWLKLYIYSSLLYSAYTLYAIQIKRIFHFFSFSLLYFGVCCSVAVLFGFFFHSVHRSN